MILLAAAAACAAPDVASAAAIDCPNGFVQGGGGTAAMHRAKAFQTSSKSFQDLPAASLDVDQGGGCLMVKFTGQLKAKSPDAVRIRVTLNDAAAGSPNQVDLMTTANAYDGRAASFMLLGVGDALVNVKVQVLSVKGGPVTLSDYNMIVQFSQPGCPSGDTRGVRRC